MRKRKVERKEKAPQRKYVVVRLDDCRQGKYLWSDKHEGVDLEFAERLAAPVPGQEDRYTVLPVEVHRWARAQGEPMSPSRAVEEFAAAGGETDAA